MTLANYMKDIVGVEGSDGMVSKSSCVCAVQELDDGWMTGHKRGTLQRGFCVARTHTHTHTHNKRKARIYTRAVSL